MVKNWISNNLGIVGGALFAGACAGAVLYNRKAINRSLLSWQISRSVSFTKRRIYSVTSKEHWTNVESLLLRESKREGAVGFDCEWVQVRGKRRPVAMLQLATSSGVCLLIRLSHMKSGIPDSLKVFLENPSILKVGVGTLEDSNYLYADYNVEVKGCVDLRHIEHLCHQSDSSNPTKMKKIGGMGLNSLSQKYLGQTLDKDWRVSASDWEAETLTKRQENYAAEDALVGIHILMMMVDKLWMATRPNETLLPTPLGNSCIREAISHICCGYVDLKFSGKRDQDSDGEIRVKPNGTLKIKMNTRAYSTRKEPLYHNGQLWAPDETLLSIINPKKAQWYITKGLGDLISQDPLIVRLKFEPAGRPLMETNEGKFRLQERKNLCVVCGKDESYIRKNIVPHEYRKFFPTILKSHENHDIVLLCVDCHLQSNFYDNSLRSKLAEEFDAPIGTEKGAKASIDKSRKAVRYAAGALVKSRSKIPKDRVEELEHIVKNFYKVNEITDTILSDASEIDVKIWNEDYQAHSQVVYEAYNKIGIVKLEQRWREHFISCMKPKYMPDCWSITHNAIKVHHKMSSLPLDHPDRDLYRTILVGTDGFIDVPDNLKTSRETSPED